MILMVVDAVCVIAAGYLAFAARSYQSYWLWSMDDNVISLSILFVMFINNMAMGKVGLYTDKRINSYWELSAAVLKAVLTDFAALAALIFLLHQQNYSRAFLLYFSLFTYVLLLICRIMASSYINHVGKSSFNARKLLVIGDAVRVQLVVEALERQLSLGHQVAEHITLEGKGDECAQRLTRLPELLKQKEIDEIIFAIGRDRSIDLQSYIEVCSRMGLPTRVLPALWDPEKAQIRVEQCQGLPFLTVHVNNFSSAGLLYKRLVDIIGGFVGFLFFMIMYPFIAVAIKIESQGPVIFKQDRVGQNGRIFKVYKFRSMFQDAERRKAELMETNEMQGPMFKMKDDPRVTRVGKFLRFTSLDEFPQFINVLKGEMSLVGTRPPTPTEVKQYDLCHYKRISAKPGLTGLWQVSGRNKVTDFEEVVRLDCSYMEDWRFSNDIKILLKTIWVVCARKGAC